MREVKAEPGESLLEKEEIAGADIFGDKPDEKLEDRKADILVDEKILKAEEEVEKTNIIKDKKVIKPCVTAHINQYIR